MSNPSSEPHTGGHRTRKPIPAYLPPPNTKSSPLVVDQALYTSIASAPRTLIYEYTLPPRSGHAFTAPAKSLIRISTPLGPQVGDLNIWNQHNPRERFWASRTRQLHASHVATGDRLWSCLPYMRPMLTIVGDTLGGRYGRDEYGGRVHDLLGTRCDPYINTLLSQDPSSATSTTGYDYHCHSNLTRAILPFGLTEFDVHDVINLFQVTSLDNEGRYCMHTCPASAQGAPDGGADYIEFFAEQDVLMALSTCPGGDLSKWGFGEDSEREMRECCRPLRIEVWRLDDEEGVLGGKWEEPRRPGYRGLHGIRVLEGEGR